MFVNTSTLSFKIAIYFNEVSIYIDRIFLSSLLIYLLLPFAVIFLCEMCQNQPGLQCASILVIF
ncbi:hypothetical protein BCV71DRAFT_181 [Rhizopus microsporus]|uniref:Uncharacterized protein n=1 Tax=Rhizopus microsporus TaxID=58291 RepID=A0A1X0SGF0_RHIZD|nr:hypothetical protein BCV71DRAFT_181 [Rhizopus microsporus]